MKLIIEDDEGRKTVVPFVREEITIGRQEGNTIRLTERNVSRKHARLLRQNGHVVVEDLGSYNGIRINGEKIAGQKAVHAGDLIQIGDYDLAIQTDAPIDAPKPAVPRDDNEPTVETRTAPPPAPAAEPEELSAAEAEPEPEPLPAATQAAEPGAEPAEEAADAEDDEAYRPQVDEKGRRQSTAVIRMDQLEAERAHREVQTLEPEEAPRLFVLNTDLQGREFACIRTVLQVGRTDDNDIALDHRSLSRAHCKIVREPDGEWRVIDLQSANGLKVNGEQYAQSALRSGDVIELGHVKLKFLAPGEPFRFVPGAYDHGNPRPRWITPVVLLAIVAVVGGVAVKYQGKVKAALAALSSDHPEQTPADAHPASDSQQPEATAQTAPPQPATTAASATDADKPAEKPTDKPATAASEAPAVQLAKVDEKLEAAREAIADREFEKAADILESAQGPDGSRPKEAENLLAEARAELAAKKNLASAQKELAAGNLEQAALMLNQVQGSSAYAKEYEQLRNRLDAARAAATSGPKQTRKSTVKTASTTRSAPPPSEEARSYYEDGTALFKKKQYREAQTLFTRCLEVDPKFARCHMMLGSTDAKLRDVESGAKHYRLFVKLAPDDPEAPRVRALLEQYDKSRNP